MPKTTWRVETKDGNQDYRLVVEVRPEEGEDWIEGRYVWRGDIFLSTQGRIHLSEMKLSAPDAETNPAMVRTIPVPLAMLDGKTPTGKPSRTSRGSAGASRRSTRRTPGRCGRDGTAPSGTWRSWPPPAPGSWGPGNNGTQLEGRRSPHPDGDRLRRPSAQAALTEQMEFREEEWEPGLRMNGVFGTAGMTPTTSALKKEAR